MRAFTLVLVLLATSTAASAGAYGKIGGFGGGPARSASCDVQWPTDEEEPLWSRLQWSLSLGGAWPYRDGRFATGTGTIVPQASWQFWIRERQCQSGGGLFSDDAWRRLSLAWSADLVWRMSDASIDLRPALRFARSTYTSHLLSVGSTWVPSTELAVTAGPTFDPGFSGAAISFAARATIFAVELRLAARTEDRGQELMLLVGVTDLHGLWTIGKNREYTFRN